MLARASQTFFHACFGSSRSITNTAGRKQNKKIAEEKTKEIPAFFERLKEKDVEWIVLAGYMRIVTNVLLDAYPNRIINIHPSLLPDFRGLDAIGQAYRAKAERMGVSIHYIDSGLDTGSLIAQEGFDVDPKWTIDECEERIHAIEHRLYTETLKKLWEEE